MLIVLLMFASVSLGNKEIQSQSCWRPTTCSDNMILCLIINWPNRYHFILFGEIYLEIIVWSVFEPLGNIGNLPCPLIQALKLGNSSQEVLLDLGDEVHELEEVKLRPGGAVTSKVLASSLGQDLLKSLLELNHKDFKKFHVMARKSI